MECCGHVLLVYYVYISICEPILYCVHSVLDYMYTELLWYIHVLHNMFCKYYEFVHTQSDNDVNNNYYCHYKSHILDIYNRMVEHLCSWPVRRDTVM